MKKTIILTMLLFAFAITIVCSQNFIKKEYDFVQWQMPEEWKIFEESFMPGVAYYSGELGPGNDIEEGVVFAVVTQKGFASEIISEMKKDPSTDVQIEAQNYLNGMKRNYYEGLIDDNGKTIWFTLSFFPATEEHSEFLVFAIASGPNINTDKAVLNHIIASVDIVAKTSQAPESPTNKAILTLLNSDNGVYLPDSIIEFEYEVEKNLLKGSPWIGIVPSDILHGDEAENDKHDLSYIYIGSEKGKDTFSAPSKEGFYDLRLHDTDFNGKELAYISFEVKKTTQSQPVISTNKKVYKPGEEIKISFKNAPAKTTTDWIGLYQEASEESNYLSWQYLNGKPEGELSFIAPRDEGAYNLRMFDNDSYNTIAISETFSVSKKDETTTENDKEVVFISRYDFCSDIRDGEPVDSKLKFSSNDERIYLHLTIEEYQAQHTLTWEWVKPDGELFDTVNLDLQSAADLGYKTIRDYNVWSWLNNSSLSDTLKGIWKINVLIDDEIILTRQFVLY